MKVKCINENGWVQDRRLLFRWLGGKEIDGPKNGDILTVIDEHWAEGMRYYRLKEWPTKKEEGWEADCFVPLETRFESVSYEEIKEVNPIGVN
jgi:hypothetical protein